MTEYISKQSVLDYLNGYLHSICEYNLLLDMGQRRALATAIQNISAIKAADVQPVGFVQNEVLNYLFNKEREAESMPYSDVRQERIATLREVIRYVEGIGDTNG